MFCKASTKNKTFFETFILVLGIIILLADLVISVILLCRTCAKKKVRFFFLNILKFFQNL